MAIKFKFCFTELPAPASAVILVSAVIHAFISLLICASVISSAYHLNNYLILAATACFTDTIHCV